MTNCGSCSHLVRDVSRICHNSDEYRHTLSVRPIWHLVIEDVFPTVTACIWMILFKWLHDIYRDHTCTIVYTSHNYVASCFDMYKNVEIKSISSWDGEAHIHTVALHTSNRLANKIDSVL